MKQRGRKSADAKAVPPNGDGGRIRIDPPNHLSVKEQKIFHQVVMSAPAAQFSASDVFLLTTFAQVTAALQDAAKTASNADDETRQQKLKMLTELAKTQCSISTKLRLAPQSRTSHITTGRMHAQHKPSAYDLLNASGWDLEDDDTDTRN
jgi:hypothetical protein